MSHPYQRPDKTPRGIGKAGLAASIERARRTLSAGNHTLLRATEEFLLLREMCRVIVELGGYRMAWVGYIEHDEPKTIRPMASAGFETGFLEKLDFTWADEGIGRGPTGAAIRTGRPAVLQNIRETTEPGLAQAREESIMRGYASVAAFPLRLDGEVLGNLSILARQPDAFDEAEFELLGELADDLAFGIKTLRTRAERDRSEECLKRVDRALRTLSAGNRTLLRAVDEHQLLQAMCRVIVDVGGYIMSWVGYAEHDEDKTIRPVAHAGADQGLLTETRFTWADTPFGHGPSGTAIRTGEPSVRRDFGTDPTLAVWREMAAKRGYSAVSAFPLYVNGEVLGSLSIAAAELAAFDEAELALLGELAEDLAFGIATLRMRAKHQQNEQTIRHMAYYDALTGLPNRTLLKERLAEAITGAKQQHQPLALLMLNVDRFQEINEVIGFRHGDSLLQALGARLQSVLTEAEMLAHLGVDQFAVLVPRADVEYAGEEAQRILKALNEPFEFAGVRVEVRASVGIALFPGHGAEPDVLILRADTAMYQAKRARNGVAVFKGDTDKGNLQRLELIGDLRRAIDENQLLLYVQPKADLRSGLIHSAEALVRWGHPEKGLIEPDRFIPLAERTGLIHSLTYWVLNTALGQCYTWHEAGQAMPLAVNLSARNLLDPRLLDRVNGLLTTWGGQPDWLQFELTESALMEDPAGALEVLKRLKSRGIKLFLDDFGTGYSSLSYLQKLPIDAIKIDKSFVQDMIRNEESLVIVRSTIELAHNLGLEVVAEGVEDLATWNQLKELGCDVAQGTYISHPIPAEEFSDWRNQSPSWPQTAY